MRSYDRHKDIYYADLDLVKYSDVCHMNYPSLLEGSYQCSSSRITACHGMPGKIGSDVTLHTPNLQTLDGISQVIGGNLVLKSNKLLTLDGLHDSLIGQSILLECDNLKTIEGCPETCHSNFFVSSKEMHSLKDFHKHLKTTRRLTISFVEKTASVTGIIDLMMINVIDDITVIPGGHLISEFQSISNIMNKWKNQGRKGVMGAMKDLIESGYEELI